MAKVISTPSERFLGIKDYPFIENFRKIDNINMHYVDEGYHESETILFLHGEPTWSYLYRHIICILSEDFRVVAPDLIGFGKSEKFSDPNAYSYEGHLNFLQQFIEQLDLSEITLVVQDWGGLLGLPLAVKNTSKIKRLVIMNTGLPTDRLMGGTWNLRLAIPLSTFGLDSCDTSLTFL